MTITAKSDAEILEIALPMIDTVVKGCNQKDWAVFSMYQTEHEANDSANKSNVERLWEEHEFLTTLSLDREILGVLRKDDVAQIVWRQTSTAVDGDYLARYFIKEVDQQIKEVGFWIN